MHRPQYSLGQSQSSPVLRVNLTNRSCNRPLVLSTWFILTLLIDKFLSHIKAFLLKIMKCVLLTFKESLFTCSQLTILPNSSFMTAVSLFWVAPKVVLDVSFRQFIMSSYSFSIPGSTEGRVRCFLQAVHNVIIQFLYSG